MDVCVFVLSIDWLCDAVDEKKKSVPQKTVVRFFVILNPHGELPSGPARMCVGRDKVYHHTNTRKFIQKAQFSRQNLHEQWQKRKGKKDCRNSYGSEKRREFKKR